MKGSNPILVINQAEPSPAAFSRTSDDDKFLKELELENQQLERELKGIIEKGTRSTVSPASAQNISKRKGQTTDPSSNMSVGGIGLKGSAGVAPGIGNTTLSKSTSTGNIPTANHAFKNTTNPGLSETMGGRRTDHHQSILKKGAQISKPQDRSVSEEKKIQQKKITFDVDLSQSQDESSAKRTLEKVKKDLVHAQQRTKGMRHSYSGKFIFILLS